MTLLLGVIFLLFMGLFVAAFGVATTLMPAYSVIAQTVFWIVTFFYLLKAIKRGGQG